MTSRGRLSLRVLAAVGASLAGVAAGGAATADAGSSTYTRCDDVEDTVIVDAARAGCSVVEPIAAAVAAVSADEADDVLAGLGWTATRAASVTGGSWDLVAVRGTGALRIRQRGDAPSLDGFSAGRELVFARSTIVGGRPVPRGAAFCTSAFLVRLNGGALGGLSAAHCGGLRTDGRVQRRNVALRRPPQPGIVLGRVLRILKASTRLDALLVPVPGGDHRTAAAVVDRGVSRPPWAVRGTARLLAGRRVCYSGRTSGTDQCGQLRGSRAKPLERALRASFGLTVRCTTITARSGDSGGPVYTAPRADGTVRAIGIVTLVSGPLQRMCFTPIAPVLRKLGATVATS